jgi:hypothetical protein
MTYRCDWNSRFDVVTRPAILLKSVLLEMHGEKGRLR